jgi:hypothetical protein
MKRNSFPSAVLLLALAPAPQILPRAGLISEVKVLPSVVRQRHRDAAEAVREPNGLAETRTAKMVFTIRDSKSLHLEFRIQKRGVL